MDDAIPDPAAAVERPLHLRLRGVALRSVALLVAALPLLIGGALDGSPVGALAGWAGFGLAGGCVFLLERRDAPAGEILLRAYLACCLAAVLLPLAWLTLSNPGDPQGAIAELGRAVDGVRPPFGLGVMATVCTPFAFAVLYVRASQARLGVRNAAWIVGGAGGAAFVAAAAGSLAPLVLWFILSALLTVVALDRLDERLRKNDPLEPAPRARSGWVPAAVLAAFMALLCLGFAAIPKLIQTRRSGNESAAIGALKTINTAQSLYCVGDKDGDGRPQYAGNLAQLAEVELVDRVLGAGVKQGYLFRVVHSHTTSEFLWAAAADPVLPGATGDRHFMINHAGVVYYSSVFPGSPATRPGLGGPAALDPVSCQAPGPNHPVWRQVGK